MAVKFGMRIESGRNFETGRLHLTTRYLVFRWEQILEPGGQILLMFPAIADLEVLQEVR